MDTELVLLLTTSTATFSLLLVIWLLRIYKKLLQDVHAQGAILSADINTCRDDTTKLETRLNDQVKIIDANKSVIKELVTGIDNLSKSVRGINTHVTTNDNNTNSKLDEINKCLTSMSTVNDNNMKTLRDDIDEIIDKVDHNMSSIYDMNSLIDFVNHDIEIINSEHEITINRIDTTNDDIKLLRSNYDQLVDQLDAYTDSLNSISSIYDERIDGIDNDVIERLALVSDRLLELHNNNKHCADQITAMNANNNTLTRTTNKRFDMVNKQINDNTSSLNLLSKRLDNNELTISLTSEKLHNDIEHERKMIAAISDKIDASDVFIESCKQKYDQINTTIDIISDAYKKRHDLLNDRINEVNSKCDQFDDHIEALTGMCEKKHKQIYDSFEVLLNSYKKSWYDLGVRIDGIDAECKQLNYYIEIMQHNIICSMGKSINTFRHYSDFNKYDHKSLYLIYKTCNGNISNNIRSKTHADYRTIDIDNMDKYKMDVDKNLYTTIIKPNNIRLEQVADNYITYDELCKFYDNLPEQ